MNSGYYKYTNWKRYLYQYTYSSVIHSIQNVELASISIKKWLDKEVVIGTENIIQQVGNLLYMQETWI